MRLEPASSYKSNFGWGQYSAQRLTYDNERDKFVNAPGPNLVTIRRQPFAQGMKERRRREVRKDKEGRRWIHIIT